MVKFLRGEKSMRTIGKVSDFQVEFGNNVFNCCWDDVQERSEENCYIGMVIECSHCGQGMILSKCADGKFRWVAYNG
jgi:hypothetical protein